MIIVVMAMAELGKWVPMDSESIYIGVLCSEEPYRYKCGGRLGDGVVGGYAYYDA